MTAKVHIKVIDRERDVEFLKCDANTKEPLSGALLKLVDSGKYSFRVDIFQIRMW